MLFLQKLLLNFELDGHWLLRGHGSLFERIEYLFSKYWSILSHSGSIEFLGKPLHFDNRLTPALLPDYYFEILELSRFLPLSELKNVFDIGANIGQFATTLKFFTSAVTIHSFEPNPAAYEILSANIKAHQTWFCYPFGIGASEHSSPFFYVAGKSAQGSLHRANAAEGLLTTDTREVMVEIKCLDERTSRKFNLPNEVDLIKIDVEGAEKSVLEGLEKTRWKYLYLEVCESRKGGISLMEIQDILNHQRTNGVKIRHKTEPRSVGGTYQVLIEA